MTTSLRDFQADVQSRGFQAWQEPNVFNVLWNVPTGGGKTVLMSNTIEKFNTATCAIAHRQELVSQISLALNRDDIAHAIIAPKNVIQQICRLHHDTHGYSRYNHRSDIRVAGVDSIGSVDSKDSWFRRVGLVVQDEAHHVQRENKWGKASQLFPNARGLFLTAHALRADGHGLGRHASGLADRLVLGPSCRDLIDQGYLTDYDIYCPDSDIDFSHIPISNSTGDLNQPKLRAATHESKHLVGDVVKEYLRRTPGKLGITFAVDVEEATKIAKAYNAAEVRAEIITAKTPISVRAKFMRQFRERILLQLVSVDCLGEGVDVPAIEVVSLARRTASFQLYAQQIGRSLRVMVPDNEFKHWSSMAAEERLRSIANSHKPRATIIDHVGNTVYFAQWHGRPCSRQNYTLDDTPMKTRNRVGPESLRSCLDCTKPYERYLTECPYCGYAPMPAGRSTPEWVEGDIVLLDPTVLESMRENIERIDAPPPYTFDTPVGGAIIKNHYARQRGQATLRQAMALWGGWRYKLGETERQAHKRFYLTFGVDNLSACMLGETEAGNLEAKIRAELDAAQVIEA